MIRVSFPNYLIFNLFISFIDILFMQKYFFRYNNGKIDKKEKDEKIAQKIL